MASRIQIARGSLDLRKDHLIDGELFWQGRNTSNNAETNFKENPALAWDEGTLYIAKPSLRGPHTDGNVVVPDNEEPIPIAGARAFKGLVYKGDLVSQENISDLTFQYVRTGDFYIFKNDAVNGTFKEVDDFRKNDILLVTYADFDIITGLASNITYTKIDCSGGDAYQTRFDNTNNNFEATDVQSAIEELEYEKLSYRGTLSNQAQVNSLRPDAGTLYLIQTDGLVFTNQSKHAFERVTKKGDFVYFLNEEDGWWLIPSGYTDSQDIDYDPTRAVELQRAVGGVEGTTYDDTHINETSVLTTVKDAIDFLMSTKAQLDKAGKVPLSQLHATVLGNLQYCGTWNPLIDDNTSGVDDPELQNPWPAGKDVDASGEDGSPTAPHNGDYYIVKTSGVNVQYRDKTSKQGESYSRIIELNAGDYIVYSRSPISDASVTDGGEYHWSVIDNSDRITQLNYIINGKRDTGEALELPKENIHTEVRIGTPTMAASDKLVLYDNAGIITIAGVRLISQKLDEDGMATVIPRYTKNGNKNELENSTIYNYTDANKGELTLFYSNVSIGDISHTFETEVHGDIHVFPHLTDVSKGLQDTQIRFYSVNDNSLTTTYRELDLRIDHNQIDDSKVYLPDQSSKIIGKLAGVDLISGRIVKSTHDGYIDNSSIEEHMRPSSENTAENGEQKYSDNDVVGLEIHAPTLTVNNAEIRHITFGLKKNLDPNLPNGGEFTPEGTLLVEEYKSNLYANEYVTENIIVYLPSRSGTLITDKDIQDQFDGEEKVLPVYGPKKTIDGKERVTLINSNIKQTANALFNTITKAASIKSDSDKEYDQYYKIEPNEDGTYPEEDEVVRSNLVVGKLSVDEEGNKYVSEPRNLLVSGDTIVGNTETNMTFIHSGRVFEDDSQYRNPYTEEKLPLTDVHVDLPAISGVLLTSNSRIDGGLWR